MSLDCLFCVAVVTSKLQFCMYVFVRELFFSLSRLSDHDRDEVTSAGADLSPRRPYSFCSASSDRLDSWQPGVFQASSVDTSSDVDVQSTDRRSRRYTGDFMFNCERPASTVRQPPLPSVREPYPISSRHSNLHNSSDVFMPCSSNFGHTFTD